MGTLVNNLLFSLFKMKYQVIVLLMCGIRNASQMKVWNEGVCKASNGSIRCCYNYEAIDGICTECKNGTTANNGGRCLPCKNNTYGRKCISECDCNRFQRCDAEAGCIVGTIISTIHYTNTGNTEPVSLPNITFSTKETTVIISGTSISEWIILTLCITGCFILTGFSYLICTYRKRQSFKLRITNEVILETLEPSPFIGVYDEIDENPVTFDTTDLNVISQESHYETIDCDAQERLSITTRSEHGKTGYLNPYFAIEGDENHQLQDRTSQKECCSTNSANSDVEDQDNTAYNNLYQPLQENFPDDSHGYEVTVMVHKCLDNFAGFDEHASSNSYHNVYKPLQKDWDMKSPTFENQRFQEKKAGNDKRLLADDFASLLKIGNLHDYINMNAESKISTDNCDATESCKPFNQDMANTIEQKSFRGDFHFQAESMNACFNNIYRFQEIDNSNSNDYDDAKSCI